MKILAGARLFIVSVSIGLFFGPGPAVAQETFSLPTVPFPTGMAFDGTSLYLSHDSGPREVFKVDPHTGTVLSSIPFGGNPTDLVFGSGHLFASDIGSFVSEIGTSGEFNNSFALPFRGGSIAFDGTSLFIGDADSGQILVTDLLGRTIAAFDSGSRPTGLVFDPDSGDLLDIDHFDSNIREITTNGILVRSCASPFDPGAFGVGGIALVEDAFYVAEPLNGDPTTGTEILVLPMDTLVCEPPLRGR